MNPWDRRSGGSGNGVPRLAKWGIAAMIGGTALGMGYVSCTEYIPPNEFAVKESKFGGGMQKTKYVGGRTYLEGPGVTFHHFPRDWQILQFNAGGVEEKLEEDVAGYRNEPPLLVESTDGFQNTFEVTVVYRVRDPLAVMDRNKPIGGPGRLFENYVMTRIRPALKKTLGQLAAEELYNPEKRIPRTEQARELLDRELRPAGIEVREVLVRSFQYNQIYEAKISGKVLQDQLRITNEAVAKAAEAEALVAKIVAEGGANKAVETERADGEVTKITSEASRYFRTRSAEGKLLVEQAEAEGQRLVNSAYEGMGSERIVGIEMAKRAAAIKKVFVKSCERGGLNPLNLGQMLRNFTGGRAQ